MTSTKPECANTWLLHCHNEPDIAGAIVTTVNGKGKLTMQTLLPEQATIRKVFGYTYGGQTFDPPVSAYTPFANKWRLEVRPPQAQTQDVFLHVLSTSDAPQPAQLIRQGDQVGVKVGDIQVLFGDRVGGTLALGANQFALRAEVIKGRYE